MVITDGVHLISDISLDELHAFAASLGFRMEWFQDHPRHPHYDLTTKRAYRRALLHGAKLVSPIEIVQVCRELYGRRNG